MKPDPAHGKYVKRIGADFLAQKKHNRRSLEKLAGKFGITNKTVIKELTELAIVKEVRKIALGTGSVADKYSRIVELYETQVNLSFRTSQSTMLQQYSTPAPISYLAGVYVGLPKLRPNQYALEPSAGNGLLTVAGDPSKIVVNEIDNVRRANLQEQGYAAVFDRDATKPLEAKRKFQAVITNPPFGRLPEKRIVDGFPINTLDHWMAINALNNLAGKGKAAIIIGGHTKWDSKGRIQAGKNRIFFGYLYSHYHVDDVINISGDLYSRQGTKFNVRLILINGRKPKPEGYPPLFNPNTDVKVESFEQLFNRISKFLTPQMWEMPFERFFESIRFYRSGGMDSYELPSGKKGIGGKELKSTWFKKMWRKIIEEALDRGEPVPAHVVKELHSSIDQKPKLKLAKAKAKARKRLLQLQ